MPYKNPEKQKAAMREIMRNYRKRKKRQREMVKRTNTAVRNLTVTMTSCLLDDSEIKTKVKGKTPVEMLKVTNRNESGHSRD